METVREVTGSAATAKSTLAYLCGRSDEPLSKNAMEGWAEKSALKFLTVLPSLSCRSYLRNMDRLTPASIDSISFSMALRLITHGHNPLTVFFGTTNLSTEQQPHDEVARTLPREGHTK